MTKPLSKTREEYTHTERERHRGRVPKVPRRSLLLFRGDPQREKNLGVTLYVVCRECGAKREKLNGNAWSHLRIHGITDEQYCGADGKWPGAPLICESLRNDLARRGEKQMEARRGRFRTELKSVRGHAGERPAPKWPIACALLNGKGYKEAAKTAKRSPMTVWTAAQSMGLTEAKDGTRSGLALYDMGEPVTAELFRRSQQTSGLLIKEFAEQVGVPLAVMIGAIRPRRKGQRTSPSVARKLCDWRYAQVRRLIATAPKADFRVGRYSGSRILRTFFPELSRSDFALRSVIPMLRQFLNQEAAASVPGVGEYICQRAMLETAQRRRTTPFRTFLPLAAQLGSSNTASLLERHWSVLKGSGTPSVVALNILATELGATSENVRAGMKVGVIPAREMRHLLLPGPAQITVAPSRRKPGPTPYAPQQKAEFKIGERVEEAIPLFEKLCALLKTLPRRARTNPQKAWTLLDGKGYSQSHIKAAARAPSKPLVASRYFISDETHLQFGVVAEYSRRFRRLVSNPKQT